MKQIEREFPNYVVGTAGTVVNLKTLKPLKHMITRKGYHLVALYKDGKRYYKSVARLVAQAFIPNPDNKPEINHKDGNKDNNTSNNLEWMTTKENIHHAMDNGLRVRSEVCGRAKVGVYAIDFSTGKYLGSYDSISEAAREYAVSQGNIGEILKGNRKQTNGLTFKRK
jgi:hypothetical protein